MYVWNSTKLNEYPCFDSVDRATKRGFILKKILVGQTETESSSNGYLSVAVQCMKGNCVFNIVVLCHVIKNSMSITSLNFSGCGLSAKAAEVLAETVKV